MGPGRRLAARRHGPEQSPARSECARHGDRDRKVRPQRQLGFQLAPGGSFPDLHQCCEDRARVHGVGIATEWRELRCSRMDSLRLTWVGQIRIVILHVLTHRGDLSSGPRVILRLWRPRATAASGRPRSRTCSGHCQWTTYGCTIMTSVLSIAGFSPLSSRILPMQISSPLHPRRAGPLRRRSRSSRGAPASVNPDGSVVFEMKDVHGPGGLVAGGGRHPGAEVLPQGRRAARRPSRVAEDGVPEWLQRSRAGAGDARIGGETDSPPGVPPPGRLLDLLGLEGRLLLDARPTPGRSTTRPATCWPRRWRPRTARSGSTPACTGPTASKGRRRGTTTSIRTRAR